MTIKLKPDCELERALNQYSLIVTLVGTGDVTSESAVKARAHLLKVIWRKVEAGVNETPDASASVGRAIAGEIMGVVSDD